MNRLTLILTVALCACQTVLAADVKDYNNMTPEQKAAFVAERKAKYRAIINQKTGGKIRKPNSAQGTFVVLNAQKTIPGGELTSVISTFDTWLHINSEVKLVEEKVTIANVKSAIKSAGGALGVALVESDEVPAFLAAPEEGWVIVNVKPLVKDVEKNVASARVRKEIMRAYGFVAGGIYMGRGAMVMREIRKPADLDGIPQEMFGIDLMSHLSQSSSRFGVTPWYETTYHKACEEGWAPAPTNDVQKAIWDKVHKLPTEPITIKPETKKVAEGY